MDRSYTSKPKYAMRQANEMDFCRVKLRSLIFRAAAKEVQRRDDLASNMDGTRNPAPLGTSIYAAQGTTNFRNDNAPVTIAVVGGTGKYRSAKGEVVTTKRADGSYRHVIILDK